MNIFTKKPKPPRKKYPLHLDTIEIKWYDATKKLPAYNVRVLCYNAQNGVIMIGHRAGTNSNGELWEMDNEAVIKITHWSPLPLLPGQKRVSKKVKQLDKILMG